MVPSCTGDRILGCLPLHVREVHDQAIGIALLERGEDRLLESDQRHAGESGFGLHDDVLDALLLRTRSESTLLLGPRPGAREDPQRECSRPPARSRRGIDRYWLPWNSSPLVPTHAQLDVLGRLPTQVIDVRLLDSHQAVLDRDRRSPRSSRSARPRRRCRSRPRDPRSARARSRSARPPLPARAGRGRTARAGRAPRAPSDRPTCRAGSCGTDRACRSRRRRSPRSMLPRSPGASPPARARRPRRGAACGLRRGALAFCARRAPSAPRARC